LDTRSQTPILKILIPGNPRYNNADEFITDFCLIVENNKKVPFKHAATWLCVLHVITQHYCKFGIDGIPQVLNARIL